MSQPPTEQHRKLAIIGIRYDENSSFTKGAADAPPQIRAALRSDAWNLTSENGTDLSGDSVSFDAGDINQKTCAKKCEVFKDVP